MNPVKAVQIIEGDIPVNDGVELMAAWQCLVDTGVIHHLQGFYQRIAADLMEAGAIDGPSTVH